MAKYTPFNQTIEVNLADSKAMKSIERYFNTFEDKTYVAVDKGLDDISNRLKKRQIAELTKYGLGGSFLIAGAMAGTSNNTAYTYNVNEYAPYVEFGTGIVGAGLTGERTHPDTGFYAGGDWEYDVNNHSEDGWVYYNNEINRLVWTMGMRSRPFMYNTYVYGGLIATKIINNNLKRELKYR